jgi:hypothetical protein
MKFMNTVACVLFAVFPAACQERKGRVLTGTEYECLRGLRHMKSIMLGYTADFLPDGNIVDLEVWMEGHYGSVPGTLPGFAEWVKPNGLLCDSGKVLILDPWGGRVVYEKPSRDPNYEFRLYSMGMNGIDEGGGGDDLDVSRPVPGGP